jgi:hypothetical protein
MTKMKFRLEKICKWLMILAIVVAAIFAIRSLDIGSETLIAFIHRVSELPRQTRVNALLNDSILLRADRVVEYPSSQFPERGIGYKQVIVYFRVSCQKSLPFAVVPKCFTLVDSLGQGYHPLVASPLFLEKGEEFWLQEGEELKSRLFFEIPKDTKAYRLRFNQPK